MLSVSSDAGLTGRAMIKILAEHLVEEAMGYAAAATCGPASTSTS